MRFLVMCKWYEITGLLPGSVIRQAILSLRDVMKRQKEEEKVTEAQWMITGNRWFIIYECESVGVLWKYLNELPLAGHIDKEVFPLMDFDEATDVIMENMEAGDNMMPGGTVK